MYLFVLGSNAKHIAWLSSEMSVLLKDALNCYVCISSGIDEWVWNIGGITLTKENRNIRRNSSPGVILPNATQYQSTYICWNEVRRTERTVTIVQGLPV